jgi:uracil-DNA glycosylase family 4
MRPAKSALFPMLPVAHLFGALSVSLLTMSNSSATPDIPARSSDDWRCQLAAHVHSLRAAGVEWLPLGPPLGVAPHPERSATSSVLELAEAVEIDCAGLAGGPAALPGNEGAPADRGQALALLAEEVSTCTQCASLASTRRQTVFGQGRPGSELCFVGEAPGADEDAQGLPFVGAAGQLLTRIILACGLKREEVYICNILKCRPPGNRTPLPNEAANCRGFLERQLDLVRPKFIVALGSCAASNLLNTTQSLGRLRGRFHDFRGIPVLVTYHPAYLLPHRSPEKKRDVWEDMKLLMAKMGREVPR